MYLKSIRRSLVRLVITMLVNLEISRISDLIICQLNKKRVFWVVKLN